MENNFEFNKIEVSNENQLHPKNSYDNINNIGKIENKTDLQSYKRQNEQTETKTKNVEQKSQEVSKILTTFVAMVSSVVIGVTGVSGIIPAQTSLVASIEEVSASVNEVSYFVYIEDKSFDPDKNPDGRELDLSGKDLYVLLHNDFTNRREKIEEYYFEGTFENLQENMTYVISVNLGDTVLASKTIKTSSREMTDYQTSDDNQQDKPNSSDTNDPTNNQPTDPTDSNQSNLNG